MRRFQTPAQFRTGNGNERSSFESSECRTAQAASSDGRLSPLTLEFSSYCTRSTDVRVCGVVKYGGEGTSVRGEGARGARGEGNQSLAHSGLVRKQSQRIAHSLFGRDETIKTRKRKRAEHAQHATVVEGEVECSWPYHRLDGIALSKSTLGQGSFGTVHSAIPLTSEHDKEHEQMLSRPHLACKVMGPDRIGGTIVELGVLHSMHHPNVVRPLAVFLPDFMECAPRHWARFPDAGAEGERSEKNKKGEENKKCAGNRRRDQSNANEATGETKRRTAEAMPFKFVAVVQPLGETVVLESLDDMVRTFAELLDGVRALHACNFVHGDLKTNNCLRFTQPAAPSSGSARSRSCSADARQVCKWIDFGLSCEAFGQARTSSLAYTDPYRPPEIVALQVDECHAFMRQNEITLDTLNWWGALSQYHSLLNLADGVTLTPACDIWALGMVFYFLVCPNATNSYVYPTGEKCTGVVGLWQLWADEMFSESPAHSLNSCEQTTKAARGTSEESKSFHSSSGGGARRLNVVRLRRDVRAGLANLATLEIGAAAGTDETDASNNTNRVDELATDLTRVLSRMLQWSPEDRASADELTRERLFGTAGRQWQWISAVRQPTAPFRHIRVPGSVQVAMNRTIDVWSAQVMHVESETRYRMSRRARSIWQRGAARMPAPSMAEQSIVALAAALVAIWSVYPTHVPKQRRTEDRTSGKNGKMDARTTRSSMSSDSQINAIIDNWTRVARAPDSTPETPLEAPGMTTETRADPACSPLAFPPNPLASAIRIHQTPIPQAESRDHRDARLARTRRVKREHHARYVRFVMAQLLSGIDYQIF